MAMLTSLLTAFLLTASMAAPESSLDRSLALLDTIEARRGSLEVRDVPLDQAIATIESIAGIPVRADWESLASLGVNRNDRVTLRLADAPVGNMLAALALSIGRDYERPLFDIAAGQVVLTTLAGSAALRETDLYDIRSLLADVRAAELLRAELSQRDAAAVPLATTAPAGAPASPPAGAPTTRPPASPPAAPPPPDPPKGAPPADPPLVPEAPPVHVVFPGDPGADEDAPPPPPVVPPATPGARLAELLMQHIDPESWLETGGGGARIDEHDGVLMVTATPRVHRTLRDLLGRLHALHPTAVEIETTIARIDRSRLDLLRRRHAPGTAALARAVAGATDAVTLWRSTVLVRLGESAQVETEAGGSDSIATNERPDAAASEPPGGATAGSPQGAANGASRAPREHVLLMVKPTLDAASSVLSIATDLELVRDGQKRRASTVGSLPLRDGGTLLEISGGSDDRDATVMVMVVTAR